MSNPNPDRDLKYFQAIFLLAGIEVSEWIATPNNYHYSYNNYWYMANTEYGLIHIGWRKRVISIDWSRTEYRGEITEDNTTKEPDLVHAWSYISAIEYLKTLHGKLEILKREKKA